MRLTQYGSLVNDLSIFQNQQVSYSPFFSLIRAGLDTTFDAESFYFPDIRAGLDSAFDADSFYFPDFLEDTLPFFEDTLPFFEGPSSSTAGLSDSDIDKHTEAFEHPAGAEGFCPIDQDEMLPGDRCRRITEARAPAPPQARGRGGDTRPTGLSAPVAQIYMHIPLGQRPSFVAHRRRR